MTAFDPARVKRRHAKTLLNVRRGGRDPWFLDDYTINPYNGCPLGCAWCYTHGAHYGINTGLAIKENAPELLTKALILRARQQRYGFIVLASATEPYSPLDAATGLTRSLLKIIAAYRFPVHVITRSPLVVRDLDILQTIHATAHLPDDLRGRVPGGCIVSFSMPTVNETLASWLEPTVAKPMQRLAALRDVRSVGLHSGILGMPMFPWLTDQPMALDALAAAASEAGAQYLLGSMLTLTGHGLATFLVRLARYRKDLVKDYRMLYAKPDGALRKFEAPLQQALLTVTRRYALAHSITTAPAAGALMRS